MAGDKGMNEKMKSMGRNLARAKNQESSKKITMKYAEGGKVEMPSGFSGNGGGKPDAFGGGQARGGKGRGRNFKGTF
jgi:hypothetical protein